MGANHATNHSTDGLHDKYAQALGRAMGEGPGPDQLIVQRRRLAIQLATQTPHDLLATSGRGRRKLSNSKPGWRFPIVLTGLSLSALAVFSFIWVQSQRSDTGQIVEASINGKQRVKDGKWLRAPENSDLTLTFNEGSAVTLFSAGRAQVDRIGKQVALSLYQGRLRARIAKPAKERRRAKWTYHAGPYRVHVTGTILELNLDSPGSRLDVSVERGSVLVVGPTLGSQGVRVEAGRTLSSNWKTGVTKIALQSEDATKKSTTRADNDDNQAPSPIAVPEARRRRLTRSDLKWKAFALSGDFGAASQAARARGLPRLFRILNAEDLYALCDSLRLSGDTDVLATCWQRIRKRFHRHRRTKLAAFQLGRIAWDQDNAYKRAAHWFRIFLNEAPTHPLAAGARGRLMLSLERSGQQTQARDVARDYLRLSPKSDYAESAKRILNTQ